MKISVILPVYNSRNMVGRVIEAYRAIDYPDMELIIVDDGSTDGTNNIASRYNLKIIHQEKSGLAKARNTGWRAASGDICYFTIADCLPLSDVITILTKYFKDEKVAAAGGTSDLGNPQYLLPRLIHSETSYLHRQLPEKVDFLVSNNIAIRKKVLEQIGGFNEEYETSVSADNDLCFRINKAGWDMAFDIRASTLHFFDSSLWNYMVQQYDYGKWRVKLFIDHKDRMTGEYYANLLEFFMPVFALMLLVEIPLIFFEPTKMFYIYALIIYTIMQFPRPIIIAIKTGRIENILLIPVTFLRGIARGLGIASGILKFGI